MSARIPALSPTSFQVRGSVLFPAARAVLFASCLALAFGWMNVPSAQGQPAATPSMPATSPVPSTAAQADLGTVRPTALYQKSSIAVPFFNVTGGLHLEPESLPRVIRRDLELSGYFSIFDAQKANAQNIIDVRTQKIDFAKWRAFGVQHYMMGSCRTEGSSGRFSVLVYLYYIPSMSEDPNPEKTFETNPRKFLVFGKSFSGPADESRDVAHQISDEVVKYLKGAEGIARTKIAYITDRTGRGLKEVAVMDADGYGQNGAPLTNHRKLCATPCWGANGAVIYFTSYRDYNPDLYGITLDGSKLWFISREPGLNTLPNWSEGRKQIVFVLSKDGNSELYSCDRAGKNLQRLTTSPQIESSPCWSPDGSMIAFTSDREGGHPQIYIMYANGSGIRRITRQGSWNDAPSWSPKGDRIAFVSKSAEGTFDVYTCSTSGDNSSWRRLTMHQGDNETPAWAPDGRHLAFASNRTGKWQIYMSLEDGSSQQQLTLLGSNQQPAWGPQPK